MKMLSAAAASTVGILLVFSSAASAQTQQWWNFYGTVIGFETKLDPLGGYISEIGQSRSVVLSIRPLSSPSAYQGEAFNPSNINLGSLDTGGLAGYLIYNNYFFAPPDLFEGTRMGPVAPNLGQASRGAFRFRANPSLSDTFSLDTNLDSLGSRGAAFSINVSGNFLDDTLVQQAFNSAASGGLPPTPSYLNSTLGNGQQSTLLGALNLDIPVSGTIQFGYSEVVEGYSTSAVILDARNPFQWTARDGTRGYRGIFEVNRLTASLTPEFRNNPIPIPSTVFLLVFGLFCVGKSSVFCKRSLN